ncbi:MAG: valine--tRNA ligase [Patescibacteria group bacterium]|jgi:valyl-tRNA synthetase
MKKELPKTYNPAEHEDGIYEKWEQSGFFNPDNLKGDPYSIMMPPPNVTGVLHLGHALENSLMDVMARYQRMCGKKVLLVPGTDHAAVATQAKVEKLLMEKGVKNPRQELGREGLLKEIKKYAEESKATILSQIRKMGTSCDWSRLAYTFDDERNLAVNTVFKKMYDDGLIYRGKRIVNWDAKLQTTISDDEIVWHEEKAPFYYLQYGPFVIATARPETKFGDKYVVMHPDDERYAQYKHGDKFECEWINGKVTATIIKDSIIEPEFGTGVMTITPWHDMVDFEIAERHNLEGEQIIDFNGELMPIAGEFAGMDILKARPKIIERLKEKNLLVKVEEDYIHRVAKGDRSDGLVEPQIKEQWFVSVNKIIPGKGKSLKDLMREAVEAGLNNDPAQKITIIPERFHKTYLNWIDNLRDWCISRQIWWGHRIPVWYANSKSQIPNSKNLEDIYVGIEPPEGEGWIQDEDTLDTWYSSALWTFSTLGWPASAEATAGKPADNDDLKTFHPTAWMQMGYEILFFWMARMILMTTYTLDEIPFRDVYIHGMLRDEKGRKFSKSSGNNIDPLDVIRDYGTDSLRLSLLLGVSPGNDSKFYEEKIIGARNFITKLWNISLFVFSNQENGVGNSEFNNANLTLADKWILAKFQALIKQVNNDFSNFRFSQAGEKLRDFTRSEFADWYLELSKFEKTSEKNKVLKYVLEGLLKLWHPFIPFITEAVWSGLGADKPLLITEWPEEKAAEYEESGFDIVIEVIKSIRNARAENKVEPAKKVKAIIYAGKDIKLIESQAGLIKGLRTGINELEILETGEKIEKAIHAAVGGVEIYLVGAIDEVKEKERIKKEVERLEKMISGLTGRLENKEFMEKAPEEIIKKEKEKLENWKIELEKLKSGN